jgi:DNA topoisomerase-1
VRVLEGRWGPYVTDGTTNASVPRGVVPEELDLERAVDLLRERAARGPTKKKAHEEEGAGQEVGRKRKATKTARRRLRRGRRPARRLTPGAPRRETPVLGLSRR